MPAAGVVQHRDVLVHTLRRVVAWALGLAMLGMTATALGVALFPVVTGGSAMAVLSGSMEPGLPVGAMAFVRPVDPATLQPGDVVTFPRQAGSDEVVTHRITAVDDSSGTRMLTTKGDANEEPDIAPVAASQVQGKLWFGVPHLGRLAAILHSPKGAGLLVVLICATVAAAPGPRPGSAPPRTRSAGGAADQVDADEARTVVMPVLTQAAHGAVPAAQPAIRRGLPPVPRPVALLHRPPA